MDHLIKLCSENKKKSYGCFDLLTLWEKKFLIEFTGSRGQIFSPVIVRE